MKLSVVDQSPVSTGMSQAQALRNSIELARLCDRLGYERYWMAEHHGMELIATSAPEVMIALNKPEEFQTHVRAAFNNGVTRDEIKEVLMQTAIYAGVPAANAAFHQAEQVFAAMDAEKK